MTSVAQLIFIFIADFFYSFIFIIDSTALWQNP